jgi:hypothetical protein
MSDFLSIKNQILLDHGCNLRVRYDNLGMLRVGVHHLVVPRDGLHCDDTIGAALCGQYFEQDFENCVERCQEYAPGFLAYPHEFQKNLISVVFLTGGPRIWLSELFASIDAGNSPRAIEILERSPWFVRDPPIVSRLIATLKIKKAGEK